MPSHSSKAKKSTNTNKKSSQPAEFQDVIRISGARVHNLKNIDVSIPRNKLVVITGLSGSGKSSLAFDTIYAEGQRRYVESLSAYARQFLGMMDKPDVDKIEGLSPAISIDQKSTTRNPRSTVGTVTEIYDYVRLLFARVGHPHCPNCGRTVQAQTVAQITDSISNYPDQTKLMIMAPVVMDRKGEHRHLLENAMSEGFARVRIDGTLMDIQEAVGMQLDKQKKHTIEIIIDRLVITNVKDRDDQEKDDDRIRIADSVETALELGNGIMTVFLPEAKAKTKTGTEKMYSEKFACVHCDINLPEIQPRSFSFNSPHGACKSCSGIGTRLEVDPILVIPNENLSIAEGAIRPWSRTNGGQSWYMSILEEVAREEQFSLDEPIKKLSKQAREIILYGNKGKYVSVKNPSAAGKVREYATDYEGVIPNLERRYRETESDYIRNEIEKYMRTSLCETCHGKRLRKEVLAVTVAGKSIDYVTELTIEQASTFFGNLAGQKDIPKEFIGDNGRMEYTFIDEPAGISSKEYTIAHQVLREISERLRFLLDVGLSYLTLDRSASTLSGGEAQRIRLATQIGSALVGVLYILDEPSIGLHQRDNTKLITTLKHLRDIGNSVIVVEHDQETIESADYVLDIGPGAGKDGGRVIAAGTPKEIEHNKDSLTGRYLSGKDSIPVPKTHRKGNGKVISIKKASAFNLQNIDADIPLGKMVCVTGVSGSGKSTLINEILAKALSKHFYSAKARPAEHEKITGLEHIDKLVNIDQSPIGRTPRSNPATYTGVFTYVRDLFASTQEAKIRGYKMGRFSFNVKGGRCEACRGDGLVRIEMQFLPDVYVECEECKGSRYNREALEIHYKGKNISEILHMTVKEALHFFKNIPPIKQKMAILEEVGLDYIQLGQSATTLSGGEAQRIKLATELARRGTGRTLYILDEPTTGLHFEDVKKLLSVLNQLVDKGNTVLVIEHNLDIIKTADHIIDLGPEGGSGGGKIIATGTPREVARVKGSYTGQYLKPFLSR
jgi:excinuclease ABC subunit A